jgi:polyphosphate glucokinase
VVSILGIDIGGSGIKAAPVDVDSGQLVAERWRIGTPLPATPGAVAGAVGQIAQHFSWRGAVGCTFPAVIKHGVTMTAANVDASWIGYDAAGLFTRTLGCSVTLVNDADAAGLAEMRYGAGRDRNGTVIVLTFGTGIGSAIFVNGTLVPNTEFGHLELRGKKAEHRASDKIRKEQDLSWEKWAARVSELLVTLEDLFWPDLLIVGGGVSRKYDKFAAHLRCQTPVVPAALQNDAGIVGAALATRR